MSGRRAWFTRITPRTHDAVLHAEAELELEIGPLDEDGGDGGAAHNAEFDLHLILQTLEDKQNPKITFFCGAGLRPRARVCPVPRGLPSTLKGDQASAT